MIGAIDRRLAELGIHLPAPSRPRADYVPFLRSGNLVYLTGQLVQWNGERRFIGKLGREFDVAAGQQAARLCALNLIAHLKAAVDGDLDRVTQCLRLAGYVNAVPDFDAHSQVINGASRLMIEVFGDAGWHTRLAVGVAGLPYNVAVEVEACFETR
jgi:enamine deaminase RidA (YjgF/YER057c/UK114 family)